MSSDRRSNSASPRQREIEITYDSPMDSKVVAACISHLHSKSVDGSSLATTLESVIKEVTYQYENPREIAGMLQSVANDAFQWGFGREGGIFSKSRSASRSAEGIEDISISDDEEEKTRKGRSTELKRSDARAQKAKVTSLQEDLKKSEGTLERVEGELKRAESEIKKKDVDLRKKDLELKRVEGNLKKVESDLKRTETDLKSTESNLKRAESDLKKSDSDLKKVQGKEAQKQKDVDAANKKLAVIGARQAELNKAKEELAKTDSTIRSLQDSSRQSESRAHQAEIQLALKNSELDTLHDAHRREINQMTSDIRILQDRLTGADVVHDQKHRDAGLMQARLQQELAEKGEELRKLHSIVLKQSNLNDALDDEAIRLEFSRLESSIQRLVKKHFPVRRSTGVPEFDEIGDPEDRVYCLRGEIANTIATNLFMRGLKPFGISNTLDQALQEFEHMLEGSERTRSDAAGWRVQTIRLAKLIQPSTFTEIVNQAEHQIFRSLRAFLREDEGPSNEFGKANRALCETAFNLALDIRMCRSDFVWDQLAHPPSFTEADVEWIDDYNVDPNSMQTGDPAKVLFGPVYKIVNGERIILKPGEILRS